LADGATWGLVWQHKWVIGHGINKLVRVEAILILGEYIFGQYDNIRVMKLSLNVILGVLK